MKVKFFRFCLVVVVVMLCATPTNVARAANNSEQVIFSGTGFGTFSGTPTPFGFWIWCEAESGNPYVGICSGAMYFYALGIVEHVAGFPPSGGIEEGPDGIYTMTVQSADGTVSCALVNASATLQRGPKNRVLVACEGPAGSGVSTNSVVNVTGP